MIWFLLCHFSLCIMFQVHTVQHFQEGLLVAGFTGYTIKQSNGDLITYLNAISTGFIVAASFTHLLPDSIEDLQQFKYPVAAACALAGFLLLVFVETVIQQRYFNMEHSFYKN